MYFLKFIFLCLIATITACHAWGQSVFAPLNQDYYHLIDRYEIKSGKLSNDFHSDVKPFERKAIVALTERVEVIPDLFFSEADEWNLSYLQNDSWEWLPPAQQLQSDNPRPVFKYLYRKYSDFFNSHDEDLDVHVNPVFHFGVGREFTDSLNNPLFINTRGVEVRGILNEKLGFYTILTENQVIQPSYAKDFIRTYNGFPYEGFTKVVDNDSTRMMTDYFSARGYLAFRPIKNLLIQFGHDKNFIGSGIRSMIMSDFSAPYLQLKLNVQVGKMQYMNIFGQLLDQQLARPVSGSTPIVPKYMAFHHLNFNILKNLNIGVFETVIFGKRQVGFDPNYLNPIIFYRFVEGLLGSSDNAIVGADLKWNFLNSFSIYGQFVLDEFNRTLFQKEVGWWGKKYGGQLGIKAIDVAGIPNLDLQVEGNIARPYLYSHFSTYSNYVSYNLPMAHPLGANFAELLFCARFQPLPKLYLQATYMLARKGEDKDGLNYGGNILRLNSDNRPDDNNNKLFQGVDTRINHLNASASYMLFHNFFLELTGNWRTSTAGKTNEQTINFTGTVRWNIARQPRML